MRSIPISNNKRPRLAPLAGDISPNSHLHAAQSAPAAINGPSSAGGSGPTYPYRLEVDLSFPSSGHISSIASSIPPHGATHPSLSSMYPHSNGLMSSQGSPPFMNSFDFSRPQQGAPTLRSVTFPSHGGSQYSGQSQQQQPGVYQSQGQRPSTQPHVQTNNLFADLLETAANEHHSAHQSSQNSFPSFDWPVHNQQSQSQRETTSGTSFCCLLVSKFRLHPGFFVSPDTPFPLCLFPFKLLDIFLQILKFKVRGPCSDIFFLGFSTYHKTGLLT